MAFFHGFASDLSLQRKAASLFCVTGFPFWEMKRIMVPYLVHSLKSLPEIYIDFYKVY